jgi:putative nucleotidyltransferase with HDIG domain
MNRDDALRIVNEFVKSKNLTNHMLAVESAMSFYADFFGQDKEEWCITGLLHDFDWEIHPNSVDHPRLGAEILRKNQVSEVVIHAILSHSNSLGVIRSNLLEKTLYACDEITGLISAVALVRPSKSLYDLNVDSVKKKWNNKSFAAGADRQEIEFACNDLGIELWDHVSNVILAMRTIAAQIDLAGNIAPPPI